MQVHRLVRVVPLAAALVVASTGGWLSTGAAEASAHATTSTTKTGRITKFQSASAFSISVAKKTYVVETNHLTHVTIDHKAAKVTALKKGETVTVKGPLEMETITATSVVEQM